ncbi:GntR family transcriptional regulator [Psychroflexus salis]|uniref:Transcriptional regulator n=1 Tax=Psychroflexus salis TaxID=1526574 RepID=A0A916ZZ31_9FLAO|nr:GntR family transcriptional regulator [Psychroflexus salis]GGE18491.1 transcriptional regulator [Psychroflexus salis]
MNLIHVNQKSNLPKYRQIIKSLEYALLNGHLKKGDKLPSLNKIKTQHSVSRDTVLMAFNELKNRGIINSIVGKGYFVSSEDVAITQKVFVLFDELNAFKEDLYNALLDGLGKNVQVDVYFHHFNKKFFDQIIYENIGDYSFYVIMPANLLNTQQSISQLQTEKVFILDQIHEEHQKYPAVFQNFENDVFEGLQQIEKHIQKYEQFNLLFNEAKQPKGILTGFEKFCETYQIPFHIHTENMEISIQKNQAYLVLEDKSLIKIIKQMKTKGFEFVKDIGLVSYNDSLLKEVLEGGITTISTDFKFMGKQLAELITNQQKKQIANPSKLSLRKSI